MNKTISYVLKGCAAAAALGIMLCIVGAVGGGKATLYPSWKNLISTNWNWNLIRTGAVTQLPLGAAPTNTTYSLDLSCDAGKVTVQRGQAFEVHTNCENLVSAGWNGSTLAVTCQYQQNGWLWNDTDTDIDITVIIPENAALDKVALSLAAGNLKAEQLSFNELTCNISAGKAELKNLTVKDTASIDVGLGDLEAENLCTQDFSCTVGAGSAEFKNFEALGKSDIDVSLGSAAVSGQFEDDVRLNVSTGSIELNAQRPADYGYQIQTDSGTVEIDGKYYSGIDFTQSYQEDADVLFDISCNLGEVDVNFTDSAAPAALSVPAAPSAPAAPTVPFVSHDHAHTPSTTHHI